MNSMFVVLILLAPPPPEYTHTIHRALAAEKENPYVKPLSFDGDASGYIPVAGDPITCCSMPRVRLQS